ncbi:amidase domain-containing protein [Archangium gephyra]|nr:amidase domain-containing protein [Archangium gephyra]
MARLLPGVAVSLVLLSSSIASAQALVARPFSAAAGEADAGELLATATAFLENRNQQLLRDGRPGATSVVSNLSETMSARAARDNAALREFRDRLALLGETYSAAKTGTRLIDTREEDGRTIARVEETSYFEYARVRGDEPTYTAFRVEREFTFSRHEGGWVLEDVRLLEQGGLAPLNEVVTEPVSAVGQLLSPPEEAADLTRPALTPGVQESFLKEEAPAANVASYDYSAMANYAVAWALGRNPSYRTFPNDCTNFISQAVTAGGWAQVSGWYQNNDVWWYNSLNQSYTWAGAENWYWFATGSGRTYMLANVWYMGVADVLQMDFENDNNINHTMMVTQIAGSEIYLSYHTTDTLNRSLSSIIAAYPSAWYYAHRT